MQMATGGCSMQRCPALAVSSIDIGPSLQELLCHLLEVVNAALQTSNLSPIHTLAPSRPGSLPPPLPPPLSLGVSLCLSLTLCLSL